MILLESEVASKVQTFAQKHPILLPNRNHLTDIIIRQVYKSNHHAGIQHTLATIRYRFWVFDSRNQVRKIVRKCVHLDLILTKNGKSSYME